MPASAGRLTAEQHRALAAALEWMQDYLLEEAVRLVDAYGAEAPPAQLADRAWLALDALRLEMEDRLPRDSRLWPTADYATSTAPAGTGGGSSCPEGWSIERGGRGAVD